MSGKNLGAHLAHIKVEETWIMNLMEPERHPAVMEIGAIRTIATQPSQSAAKEAEAAKQAQ